MGRVVRAGVVGVFVMGSSASAGAAPSSLATSVPVQHVTGGANAEECEWPDTVAVVGGGLCTGTLVHPRVVTYAAHCGAQSKTIRFGERSTTPAYTRQVEFCMTNPDYTGNSDQAHDWAFCVLAEPITELPFTPPLYGCEIDLLQQGVQVVIAGFGEGGVDGPSGIKRWAWTQVNSVFGNTTSIGGVGNPATCSGDSGSSAFLPMADGSWRSISMLSTSQEGCGDGGTFALMHPAVPWIEAQAQIDITPCHDLDGTWNPTGACGGFYAGDEVGHGAWEGWCEGTPTSAPADSCGDPYDAAPDPGPPVVTITAPQDRAELPEGEPVDILIDADDGQGYGVKTVWASINGDEQDVRDSYPPYEFPAVPFPKGVYTIVGFAEDYAGNVGESEPIVIGVGEAPPQDPTTDTGDTGDEDTSSGGTAGTTTAADGGDGGSGCSCRSSSSPWWWLGLVPIVALGRGRLGATRV